MAPSDENQTRQLLYTGYMHKGPAAVRYPRGTGPGESYEIGISKEVRIAESIVILCFGSVLNVCLSVAEELNTSLFDMRFIKPIDEQLIRQLASAHQLLVTLEENSIAGGAGAAVSEFLAQQGIVMPVLHIGLPDRFIDHGNHSEQLRDSGLDTDGILHSIEQRLNILNLPKRAS